MRSMSILEEMMEIFATTVQAELNATLHVCEGCLQDVLTNRSNFTSNVVFQFLYVAWLAFSSAWTVVANISIISSSIDMLLMKHGM